MCEWPAFPSIDRRALQTLSALSCCSRTADTMTETEEESMLMAFISNGSFVRGGGGRLFSLFRLNPVKLRLEGWHQLSSRNLHASCA